MITPLSFILSSSSAFCSSVRAKGDEVWDKHTIGEVGDDDLMVVAPDILFLHKTLAADDDDGAPAQYVLGGIMALLAAGSS